MTGSSRNRNVLLVVGTAVACAMVVFTIGVASPRPISNPMLLRNVPIRLVASLHNTSVAMVEKHYSRFITEYSIDDITRAGLLSEPAPAADNVVSIAG